VFDPLSALNPGAVGEIGRLAAGITMSQSFRSYTAGDSTVSGLHETRFPFGFFGGRITGTPLSFAVSYSTYAERTYDVRTSGTEIVRGDSLGISDRVVSDGAITDVRGALASRPWPFLEVGAAIHMLGGSSRLSVSRLFSDSAYLAFAEQKQLVFSGLGFSAGFVLHPMRRVELAASARVNGRLTTREDSTSAGSSVQLPVAVSGGLRLLPFRGVSWSTTASWHSWSTAQSDLVSPGRAFDTWELASGIELNDHTTGVRGQPLRLGVRYRQLPFSNVATQPSELVLAAGSGWEFASRRAAFDFSVEHLVRSGGGADEHGWQLTVGILVVP
jgi:hypothetical protein